MCGVLGYAEARCVCDRTRCRCSSSRNVGSKTTTERFMARERAYWMKFDGTEVWCVVASPNDNVSRTW